MKYKLSAWILTTLSAVFIAHATSSEFQNKCFAQNAQSKSSFVKSAQVEPKTTGSVSIKDGMRLTRLIRMVMTTYADNRVKMSAADFKPLFADVRGNNPSTTRLTACVILRDQSGKVVARVFKRKGTLLENMIKAALKAMRAPGLPNQITVKYLQKLTIELAVISDETATIPLAKLAQAVKNMQIRKNFDNLGDIGFRMQVGDPTPGFDGVTPSRGYQDKIVLPCERYRRNWTLRNTVKHLQDSISISFEAMKMKLSWSLFRAMHFVNYPYDIANPRSQKTFFIQNGSIWNPDAKMPESTREKFARVQALRVYKSLIQCVHPTAKLKSVHVPQLVYPDGSKISPFEMVCIFESLTRAKNAGLLPKDSDKILSILHANILDNSYADRKFADHPKTKTGKESVHVSMMLFKQDSYISGREKAMIAGDLNCTALGLCAFIDSKLGEKNASLPMRDLRNFESFMLMMRNWIFDQISEKGFALNSEKADEKKLAPLYTQLIVAHSIDRMLKQGKNIKVPEKAKLLRKNMNQLIAEIVKYESLSQLGADLAKAKKAGKFTSKKYQLLAKFQITRRDLACMLKYFKPHRDKLVKMLADDAIVEYSLLSKAVIDLHGKPATLLTARYATYAKLPAVQNKILSFERFIYAMTTDARAIYYRPASVRNRMNYFVRDYSTGRKFSLISSAAVLDYCSEIATRKN